MAREELQRHCCLCLQIRSVSLNIDLIRTKIPSVVVAYYDFCILECFATRIRLISGFTYSLLNKWHLWLKTKEFRRFQFHAIWSF
jgi:hypothetical protein